MGSGYLQPAVGGGRDGGKAPHLVARRLAGQVVLFIFRHLIYKIVPFTETAPELKHSKYRHSEVAFN